MQTYSDPFKPHKSSCQVSLPLSYLAKHMYKFQHCQYQHEYQHSYPVYLIVLIHVLVFIGLILGGCNTSCISKHGHVSGQQVKQDLFVS